MASKLTKVKLLEWVTYLAPLLIGIGIFSLCAYLQIVRGEDIVKFYKENMRASFFAGFLTLGSFLLSLKTGIVIKIKENVYDKEGYQKKVSAARLAGSDQSVYGPLRRLSRVLSAAVLAALVCSVLQLTLGLLTDWWAAALCLSFAAVAIALLLTAFYLIQVNLNSWFDFLDDEANSAHTKRQFDQPEQLTKAESSSGESVQKVK